MLLFDLLNESEETKEQVSSTIDYLQKKKKILFLTTSNRWEGDKKDIPKSTLLAKEIQKEIGKNKVTLVETPKLNIYPCEGNVSSATAGNNCGVKEALIKNKIQNPSNYLRCWASINHKDDELWKVTKPLFESDTVVFFVSVRWGQTNMFYQKLIERLTWIENRHSSLGESNIVKNIDAGIILIGHNWNGKQILSTQKNVLDFYGFKVRNELCWNWQWTNNPKDETLDGYKKDIEKFEKDFNIDVPSE